MIVASSLPFRFRAVVDYRDISESNRLHRFLEGLEGKVAVMNHPMISGRLICDFDRVSERDAFQRATQRGVPAPAVLKRRYNEAALAA